MTCAVPTHAVPTNLIAEQHTSTDTDAQLSSRSVDTSPADDISISDSENTSDSSPMRWWDRARAALFNERGMATLEYALVCVAAAAFAGLLYVIVSGGEVENALKGIIEDALNSKKK